MMPTPTSSPRTVTNQKLTVAELKAFMDLHGFSKKEFADFLGVTVQAVKLWLNDDRDISVTNSRLIRLLTKFPQLIKEF